VVEAAWEILAVEVKSSDENNFEEHGMSPVFT
jgi:hypothetical protein